MRCTGHSHTGTGNIDMLQETFRLQFGHDDYDDGDNDDDIEEMEN